MVFRGLPLLVILFCHFDFLMEFLTVNAVNRRTGSSAHRAGRKCGRSSEVALFHLSFFGAMGCQWSGEKPDFDHLHGNVTIDEVATKLRCCVSLGKGIALTHGTVDRRRSACT